MVKQGTSNLVHKLTMASFNRRMIKYPQMGCGQGYVTIFFNFLDPEYCQSIYGISDRIFKFYSLSFGGVMCSNECTVVIVIVI